MIIVFFVVSSSYEKKLVLMKNDGFSIGKEANILWMNVSKLEFIKRKWSNTAVEKYSNACCKSQGKQYNTERDEIKKATSACSIFFYNHLNIFIVELKTNILYPFRSITIHSSLSIEGERGTMYYFNWWYWSNQDQATLVSCGDKDLFLWL